MLYPRLLVLDFSHWRCSQENTSNGYFELRGKQLAAKIGNRRWGKEGELNRSRLQDPFRFNISEKSQRLEPNQNGEASS